MKESNGRIFITEHKNGNLETDITGLLYLLREKRIEPDTVVEAFVDGKFKFEEEKILIDSYLVEETDFGDYVLARQEDDYGIELEFYLDLGDEEIDVSEMFNMDLPMYFELDEMTVSARYYIQPAKKKKDRHIHIITHTEALAHIEQGKTVYLDFMSENEFKPIDSDDDITADMLIEGIWGISSIDKRSTTPDLKKAKEVNPFTESPDTVDERLNEYFLKEIQLKKLSEDEKDDLLADLLNKFLQDDIDNWLDDDIMD